MHPHLCFCEHVRKRKRKPWPEIIEKTLTTVTTSKTSIPKTIVIQSKYESGMKCREIIAASLARTAFAKAPTMRLHRLKG
jgi:hypothetical protein